MYPTLLVFDSSELSVALDILVYSKINRERIICSLKYFYIVAGSESMGAMGEITNQKFNYSNLRLNSKRKKHARSYKSPPREIS